jgi:hypothetical protein
MITISVPVAMPAIEKVLVTLMVRLPMPAVMPAPAGQQHCRSVRPAAGSRRRLSER